MKGKVFWIGGVVVLLMAVGVTLAVAQTDDVVYFACVNNDSGTIKVFKEPTECKSNEFKVTLNSMGPMPQHTWSDTTLAFEFAPGEYGDPVNLEGQVGPEGPEGPAGADGTVGPARHPEGGRVRDIHIGHRRRPGVQAVERRAARR